MKMEKTEIKSNATGQKKGEMHRRTVQSCQQRAERIFKTQNTQQA